MKTPFKHSRLNNQALSPAKRLRRALGKRSFWILALMMVGLSVLHYLTPQVRWMPFVSDPLGRHAVERIVFVLPIAGATFAFGLAGGLATLICALVVMLPRVVFFSPYPVDAVAETVAVGIVGYLVVWMIDTQEREKQLRQEAVTRMRTLNAVITIASESLELEQILGSTLEKIVEAVGTEAGCAYLLAPDGERVTLAVHRGFTAHTSADVAHPEMGEGLCERLNHRPGEVMLVGDLLTDEGGNSAFAGLGFRSLIVAPLTLRDEMLGGLACVDSRPNVFDEHDTRLFAAIGQQVGVAVDNARLHQNVARQLRIQQQLNEVSEKITSELELGRILPKVLQISKHLVGAAGGFIALVDRDGQSLSYPYLDNLPTELAQVTVSSHSGLAGEVVARGQPLIVNDYPGYANALPDFVAVGVQRIVAVPILSGDELFGTLGLVNFGQGEPFLERDVSTLCSVGRQAGIAIKNAHLYENFRFYVQQITQAQEEERKRIARDLHDDTVQALIALSRRLEALDAFDAQMPENAVQRLHELQQMTREMVQSVRRFSRDLRPSILDHLGLIPALESLLNDVAEQDDLRAELNVVGERRRLSPQAELLLFRITQEALSNARKHAQATHVSVTVAFSKQSVQVTVEDNGKGFEPPALTGDLASSGKLGLIGMAERVRLLEGTLEVQSQPGHGTRVVVNASR
ncbi:MAG: GAF domain-containing sensor histidine kinase [Anaerolineae bacterium]|nr:GAF domain-containing sensor histidine kinase [Anaerolineae bacterium]